MSRRSAVGEITDFDPIDHAAGRLHCEIREDGMLWVDVRNRMLLVAGTLDAAKDFILIRGPPVDGGDGTQSSLFFAAFSAGMVG